MADITLSNIDKSELSLVGTFAEVRWTANNRLAARQCEKCVYLVRGVQNEMLCIELVYDAIEGSHRNDTIYWVPMQAIQYLRVLSDKEAQRRIDRLEREAFEGDMPRD